MAPPFAYVPILPATTDQTPYRALDMPSAVRRTTFEEVPVTRVDPEALAPLARQAFFDINHFYRPGHLAQLRAILEDPESADNDRFVALEMLKNAVVASGGTLPMCQDTGTAIIMGKKGQQVWTGGGDAAHLSRGVYDAYQEANLRYSQMAPLSLYEEKNTGTNLPAQIDIEAVDGDAYKFLFMAKGGGSANKTYLFQETPALLKPDRLLPFLDDKIRGLGTAACPPYHLAVVIGGTSAEANLKTVKLASARWLDGLPTHGNEQGQAFRDRSLEAELLRLSRDSGIGAQFGGRAFCHDARVIRLPRHGASLPVGLGVSCSADRQAEAKITRDGVFLESLESDPARFLPDVDESRLMSDAPVRIDLNRPMREIRETLSQYPIKTRLLLSGPMIVARDLAHARLKAALDRGEGLPDYFREHCVYYAGPAKQPAGYPAGSFGPTTAGRMDAYVDEFQKAGGSMVMLAKGNRSAAVREACRENGGFYLGSIGGAAAQLAEQSIKHMEVLAFEDLGMEAVWKIEVEDFPAFIIMDDKGNDFFAPGQG